MIETQTLRKVYKTMSLNQIQTQIKSINQILRPVLEEMFTLKKITTKNSLVLQSYAILLRRKFALTNNLENLEKAKASTVEIKNAKSKLETTTNTIAFLETNHNQAIDAFKRRFVLRKLNEKNFQKRQLLEETLNQKLKEKNIERIKG